MTAENQNQYQREREALKSRIKTILLEDHKGYNSPITQVDLFVKATRQQVRPGRKWDETRIVRSIIRQLRQEGLPIGTRNGTAAGYFIAETDEEMEATINKFHKAGLGGFRMEAALKNISFTELFKQYQLELEGQQNDKQAA